jgi:integrase/recombinase XerD
MGYSASTVQSLPSMLQEFLHYLETHGLTDIRDATPTCQQDYIRYLSTRRHHRGEGALSAVHINGHIGMLERFSEYLHGMEGLPWPVGVQRLPEEDKTDWVVLSLDEIHRLYQSTMDTIYGLRDRALLAVYYGCGCRKSEGAALNVIDVLIDRRLLIIRKSKNGRGRQIPMTTTVVAQLQQYIETARPLFTAEGQDSEALFISQRGSRLSAEMIYLRIKELQRHAGLDKEIGLHTLRHSIATHLLQKGMPLENIALFLGHESLDSTQIYTHIQPII